MKYFVCNCFYAPRLGCGVVSIKRLIAEDFIDFHYLTLVKNDYCYICCKETIMFLFDCYCYSVFDCTCATTDHPVSCIEMVEFGNEDICQICEKTLFFYFSGFLNLVYNDV